MTSTSGHGSSYGITTSNSALRDGDRFWYTRTLGPNQRAQVEATLLSDIIRRNTDVGDELADDVFRVPAP
ncbi:MAG: peroxidase family protein [Candidatus Binatia bacterium]|nr:peroxidase family protein [Candidatus Binatia bacterium]